MTIQVHDTMAGKKVPLELPTSRPLGIYACGVTVYDRCHLGHARSAVAFDVVARYLAWRGVRTKFVRNFTDVDDKIIARANERGVSPAALAEENIEAFYRDMGALGVVDSRGGAPAGLEVVEPRVTTTMPEIIDLVRQIVDRGHAYVVDGDVYYSVRSFPRYGRLSRRDVDDLRCGARVGVDERKQDPLDFALWKAAKPGEPEWASPWGPGRPGWHIECSAMNLKHIGETTDIHGGGKDLVFPHHENEIAQTEGATGVHPWVRCWMHNGFVNIDDEKMSKSLGNFFTIEEVLRVWDAQTLRFFLLTTHWRSPISYSTDNLDAALGRLTYLEETLARVDEALAGHDLADVEPDPGLLASFSAAMDDDFNTAAALAVLSAPFKECNDRVACADASGPERIRTLAGFRKAVGEAAVVLGVLGGDPAAWLGGRRAAAAAAMPLSPEEVEERIAARAAARKARDWAKADAVRDELKALGIVLRDGAEGTTWTVE